MSQSRFGRTGRAAALALAICCTTALAGHKSCGLDLDALKRMDPCQYEALFTGADIGRPITGVNRGRLLHLNDRVLPRAKVRWSNSVWRGKVADDDGWFINRWIAGVRWIDSRYTIGPSWLDGRPAIIMEYAPGTPLFANMHDELREVAPGVYLGPVYERCPCPRLRGWVGLQVECGR